ncbi:MAG: M1 family metallopeptidase [Cytophagaceae bacterium]|nr:M1 family metallopeptidase [Cytophagaceae bacterium]
MNSNSYGQRNAFPKKTKTISIPSGRDVYHPSRDLDWDLIHTTLHLSFRWDNQTVIGRAELTVKPHVYRTDSIVLDAKAFLIDSIRSSIPMVKPYLYDGEHLTLYFTKKLSATDTVRLDIRYIAQPDQVQASRRTTYIYGNKGLYFINPLGKDSLKPKQIWTQGETEASSCWFPTLDSPNQKTTQEMFIDADSNYTVLSNGVLQSVTLIDSIRRWHWKMDQPHAPYLFMLAIGEFSKIDDQWRDIPLAYYVEPAYAPYAQQVFGHTPEMMEFFSTLLDYPYPWKKYSQITVRDFVSGAMENTTATILMEDVQLDERDLYDENWDAIIAHELFHHWFGDLVTCESWANLALNESFATYSEYLWYDYKFGMEKAMAHLDEMRQEYFDESKHHIDPIIRYHYNDRDDMFDRHTYNKGGLVLHHLRSILGDTVFFKAISQYLHQHAFTQVEIDELRMAFEDVSGKDLHWFFTQWFLKPGHPQLHASLQAGMKGGTEIKIQQVQDTLYSPIFTFPIEIAYRSKTDTTLRVDIFWVQKNTTTLTLPVPYSSILTVIVDPFKKLPAEIFFKQSDQQWLQQALYGPNHLVRIEGLEKFIALHPSESTFYESDIARDVLEQFLRPGAYAAEKQLAMLQFTRYYVPGFDIRYLPYFHQIATEDPDGLTQSIALRIVARYQPEKYVTFCKTYLSHPSNYVVAGALECLLEWKDPYVATKLDSFKTSTNVYILIVLLDHIIREKKLGEYQWLAQKIKHSDVTLQYNLILYLYKYVIFDTANRKNALVLLDDLIATTGQDFIREEALTCKKHIQKLKK